MEAYSKRFFEQVHAQVRDSAREIVPLVVDLLNPARVVDVGCGTGTWLATFAEHGAAILGLDGEYVDRSLLDIPEDRFVAVDLAQPFQLDGRYDLALCLEVAEHLPADRAASLVDLLTGLAPTVLFSAAIPLQGGVNHVNEQWPDTGWRISNAGASFRSTASGGRSGRTRKSRGFTPRTSCCLPKSPTPPGIPGSHESWPAPTRANCRWFTPRAS